MFRAVISRDNGNPWGHTGLTSTTWLDVPARNVLIEDLIATQDGVYFHALTGTPAPVGGDPLPHVVHWAGAYYLEDGHHRVVRARLSGCDRVLARVLRMG